MICAAVRTPLTKAKRGLLKDTAPEILLATVFKAVCERAKLDPKLVDDVAVGNVSMPGAGAIVSKMAAFLGGLPDTT